METPKTMNDIINMTSEEKDALEKQAKKNLALFISIRVGASVAAVVAAKALEKYLMKKFENSETTTPQEHY